MIARIHTATVRGIAGVAVEVEADMRQGLPAIQIVGMGNKSVDEARERVRSAIRNSMLEVPARKFAINLAPAAIPKEGSHFDLPIALALLVASHQLRAEDTADGLFLGELSLSGDIRPIQNIIILVEVALTSPDRTIYVPQSQAALCASLGIRSVIGVANLRELFQHLKGVSRIPQTEAPLFAESIAKSSELLFHSIHGQEVAKRALTIAIAGRHNILFYGPPGSGKSMLAKAAHQLMPPLTQDEQHQIARIHSMSRPLTDISEVARPFRTPHPHLSRSAFLGGGAKLRPGELSLAHLGTLFLDELPEYPRSILESLRQPLEDRSISLARPDGAISLPADIMLIATMNPCPCGYYGDPTKTCECTPGQIQVYRRRLSGPLLDRIDLIVPVSKIDTNLLMPKNTLKLKQHLKELTLIDIALMAQNNRYKSRLIYNSSLSNSTLESHTILAPDAKTLLSQAAKKLNLSARTFYKTIKIAQTICDMDGQTIIGKTHIAEALQYRGHGLK